MEQNPQYTNTTATLSNEEISIFDDLKPVPVYYSEKAIYIFSALFSTLFGAILLAINLNTAGQKKAAWQAVIVGSLYAIVLTWGLSYFPKNNAGIALGLNGMGGYMLRQFFWPKYLGKDVIYTKRSVLIPAIIGVLIATIAVIAVIYTTGLTN